MDLEKNAIGILQTLCGNSGCVISDSGGKDSSVIKQDNNMDFRFLSSTTTPRLTPRKQFIS